MREICTVYPLKLNKHFKRNFLTTKQQKVYRQNMKRRDKIINQILCAGTFTSLFQHNIFFSAMLKEARKVEILGDKKRAPSAIHEGEKKGRNEALKDAPKGMERLGRLYGTVDVSEYAFFLIQALNIIINSLTRGIIFAF
ncbi:CLUMA_CG017104, isoform A [Clunio marinus]|uniref:CLUMA_CG017104, isoform A n=1 Tax=Clunio marinus TaxID=568069 RepID=A0A1J1IZH5_9DIPT|nr:CLUMA_CG017104, isoform A [Clunio marinus]